MLIALATVITLAFGSIGLIAGMRASSPENVQGLFPVIFVFLFLSSMALPRDLIQTQWFETVATYNPVSYMIEDPEPPDHRLGRGGAGTRLRLRDGDPRGGADGGDVLDQGKDGEDLIRRYFSVAGGLARRLIDSFISSPALFLPPLLMPIFFFVAFAGGLSAITEAPGFDYPPGYTTFEYGFVLLQAAAFGGVFTGFSIAADFQFGFGRRLLLATPNRSALILGYGISRWCGGDRPDRGHGDRAIAGIEVIGLEDLLGLPAGRDPNVAGTSSPRVGLRCEAFSDAADDGARLPPPLPPPGYVPRGSGRLGRHRLRLQPDHPRHGDRSRAAAQVGPTSFFAALAVVAGCITLLSASRIRGLRKAEAAA